MSQNKDKTISPSPNKRISRELKTIEVMIEMYCHHHHHPKDGICEHCNQLYKYSERKTIRCKFGTSKPACSSCPVHCYKPEKREEIRKIMKYSGPRMIYKHPYFAMVHVLDKYILNRNS